MRLARFYSVMGNRPDEPGALALMAEILCRSATDEQITQAITRCTRECRYPVRLPDLLQRIGGQEIPAAEAEARKAWDKVTWFADKWVQSEPEGNYVISRGVRATEPPELSTRILDVVRRTGGWRIYKTMNEDDYPHQQKRFFEEYAAWTAVERTESSKLLCATKVRSQKTRRMTAKIVDYLGPMRSVESACVEKREQDIAPEKKRSDT